MKSLPWTASLLLLLAASTAIGLGADQPLSSGPPVGKELPGPFAVLNVTGDWRGKYHCPITESGLNPGILIFFRQPPAADSPVAKLLKGLNDLSRQTKAYHLGVAAIYLNDAGYTEALQSKVEENKYVTDMTFAKALIFKEKTIAELTRLADDAKLDVVELSMGTAAGPKDYHLTPDADVTVIVYFKLGVIGNFSFARDQLTDAEATALVNRIKDILSKIENASQGKRS